MEALAKPLRDPIAGPIAAALSLSLIYVQTPDLT
jgi:hypothetical protein